MKFEKLAATVILAPVVVIDSIFYISGKIVLMQYVNKHLHHTT